MLPARSRMHRPGDFRAAVRGGVRSGRPTLVVHAGRRAQVQPDPTDSTELSTGAVDNFGTGGPSPSRPELAPRVGFVVSKAVGNAVTRNRVKRRLRHLCRPLVDELDDGTVVVVRALPPAATQPDRVAKDLDGAWHQALRKLR
ncbi:ribonuclease P protein component [Cutibacterium equinum]|uniref:Ribonuclease P protein component n=1 Tax=Cutibacterium equinum TaxID=3016342 RepID=A0ABY7QZS3_9ACTN|nr:ribonuclease P protein component [Cutibacterium equinum]WCC79979.1 ribonuclease P protein component [Cutibacterium equinum]